MAAHVEGAAGDAGHGEVAVLHGDLGVVHDGDGAANAEEVVVAVALKVGLDALDGVLAVAGDDHAVEALFAAGHVDALGLAVGDLAALQDGGHGLSHLAVLDDDGGIHLAADLVHAHQTAGGHVVGVGDGQHHVALIGAGLDLLAHAVDGEGQELALGSGEHRAGADGQLVGADGLLDQPRGLVREDLAADLFQNFGIVHSGLPPKTDYIMEHYLF